MGIIYIDFRLQRLMGHYSENQLHEKAGYCSLIRPVTEVFMRSHRENILAFACIVFFQLQAKAAPVLVSPSDGAVNQPISLTFSWTAVTGTIYYGLQVSADQNFQSDALLVNVAINNASTTSYTTPVEFIKNAKLFWRVKSYNSSNLFNQEGWSAIHSFTTLPAATTNGNVGSTDIGIWYNAYAPWETPQARDSLQQFLPLRSGGPADYGYYSPTDTTEIDYHLQEIANAKMDFLIFESTNGGFSSQYTVNNNWNVYVNNSKVVCQRINKWNQSHSWKIKYVHAIGVFITGDSTGKPIFMGGSTDFSDCINKQADTAFNYFVNNPGFGGPDNWYRLDGKPLLILFIGAQNIAPEIARLYDFMKKPTFSNSIANKFTIRFAGTGQTGSYGWPAWGEDFSTTQSPSGTRVNDEVMVVNPGYAAYNVSTNPWAMIPRANGSFYRNQGWERVLSNKKPRIVVISSFNDYLEKTAIWPALARYDCVSPVCEPWTNSFGVEDPTMYWSMTKGYIYRMRGSMTPINSLILLQ